MLFALSLLLPLVVIAVWIFWRLSPQRPNPAPLRLFNVGAIVLGLLLAVGIAFYVRHYLSGTNESGKWPGVTAYYVATLFPLWLALAGGLRSLLFRGRGPAKPLEISQDLSKTRF
jgi:multisubunit Na+/H+ antiporter MnhE subunit